MKFQPPHQAINISLWEADADYSGVFPKGAREKSLYNSPENVDEYSFLKANFKYLFKESFYRYPEQYWAEVIAYKVGYCVGVTVPPAFVAFREEDDGVVTCGALIEWFYDDKSPLFLACYDGGDLLGSIIPDFDHKRGTKHNFKDIIRLFQLIASSEKYNIDPKWIFDWIRIIVFDAIIGNTDRHQNNWGVILNIVNEGQYSASLGPAFDNGTSLGHEILGRKFGNFKPDKNLERYINRGKHHMKLDITGERMGHLDSLDSIFSLIPKSCNIANDMLKFNFGHLEHDILNLTQFAVPTPLSKDRCEFVLMLLYKRIEKLKRLTKKYMT